MGFITGVHTKADYASMGLVNKNYIDPGLCVFTDPDIIKNMSLARGVVMKKAKEVVFDPFNPGDYLELDLLGHGIARIPGNDYYVLVLEKERLHK